MSCWSQCSPSVVRASAALLYTHKKSSPSAPRPPRRWLDDRLFALCASAAVSYVHKYSLPFAPHAPRIFTREFSCCPPQVMVFVHSRKETGKTGRALADLAAKSGELHL